MPSPQPPEPLTAVDLMLDLQGIPASPDEREAMAATFAASRAAAAALYTLPGVRYELPALTWSAAL
ncbi:MAG: hypothetical protein U0Q15_06745 [Kineosporiaceae bacterium]